MRKPIHTPETKYFKILKPILWFHKDEKISTDEVREYFTQKAIKSLLDSNSITVIE